MTVRIAQSSDDAEELSDGSMVLAKTNLWMDLYDDQSMGLRFPGISVPRGATITNAQVQFHVDGVQDDLALTTTFSGHAVDDAPTFTTAAGNITSRPVTAASVDWAIPHWPTVHAEGPDQLSADLSGIVQEIVDRDGWTSGNALAILLLSKAGPGWRDAEAWDGEAASAPQISITYTTSQYRSKGTGNWSSASTWERYDGASWVDATAYPDGTNAEAITILAGHTVTVDAGVGASIELDQMTVNAGGAVVVDEVLSVADGTDTDLTVAGQLTVSVGGGLTLLSSFSGAVSPGGQITIAGQLIATISGTLQVGGTLLNSGTIAFSGTSSLEILSGGLYQHGINGGAFPGTANTTWNTGSTAEITGVTTTLPTGLDDSFHHFTWNATGQTTALDLAATPMAIAGNLTITSTGSSTLTWGSGDNLTISGNYVQTGGSFIFSDAGGTFSATNVGVTGGTLTLTTGASIATLDLDGDLAVQTGGALTETGSSTASIKFTGSSTQSVSAASGLSGDLDFYVENTGGIQLLDDFVGARHITGTTGTLDLNDFDLSLSGSLTINSDISNPAAITFTGGSTRTISYAPGTLSLPTLVVNKPSGVLALATAVTVTTTASVLDGTLNTNSQTLTFPTGTTLYNAGTVTGDVIFERAYTLVQDGWRMIASPLDGVSYSSLNTNFHTQGAPWADFTDGTATLQEENFAEQDWTLVDGADADFSDGDGYIFYMYEELLGSALLPATWSVTGTVRASANRSLSWNTVSTDSYNLVGNRTTSNIDWDAAYAASTNVASTYSTWDPALTSAGGLTGYKYYNQATGIGLAGRYIAPFTAFEVEPTASGGTFVFSTSEAANLASANYFGKREGASPHVRFMVEGEGRAELETYLVFDPEASDGQDRFDGNRMKPLSEDFVTLVSLQDERALVYDARSMRDGLQEYTLGVAATKPGLYTLTWPDWHEIPDDWEIVLYDRADGRRADLRADSTFVFSVDADQLVEPRQAGRAEIDARPRFDVMIAAGGRKLPEPQSSPGKVVLTQNYPNPFNPVTTIRYLVRERDSVRLEVFDTLGRRVAMLVGASEDPGWKEVRWDAGHLPSGLYVYRLQVGGEQHVRTMMLTR